MFRIRLARGAGEIDGMDDRHGEAPDNPHQIDPEHPGPFGRRGGGVREAGAKPLRVAGHVMNCMV